MYHANLAACHLSLKQHAEAVHQASEALAIDANYVKAFMRRAAAHEALDELDHALADAQAVARLDPASDWARRAVARLEPKVQERQEAVKAEMLGKLKDLGNTILGKFGMSLDNFKAEKDPATGSYSIQFKR